MLHLLPPFEARELHLGDIALVPHMDYVMMLGPMFGVERPLQEFPRVAAWRDWILADEAVARASGEMHTAVQAFFSS